MGLRNPTSQADDDNDRDDISTSTGHTIVHHHQEIFPSISTPASPSPRVDAALPPWAQELNRTRDSRASSVISTRTRFSATTLQEDARSIEINVGGQSFRISRDGSRISDGPPPSYTGPLSPTIPEGNVPRRRRARARHDFTSSNPNELSVAAGQLVSILWKETNGWWLCSKMETDAQGWTPAGYLTELYPHLAEPTPPTIDPPRPDFNSSNAENASRSQSAAPSILAGLGPRTFGSFFEQNGSGSRLWGQLSRRSSSTQASANILDPKEVDMPSPVHGLGKPISDAGLQPGADGPDENANNDTPDRVPSYKAGKETISVSQDWSHQRCVSDNDMVPSQSSRTTAISPLRRRNGVRLPTLVTNGVWQGSRVPQKRPLQTSSQKSSPLETQSAGPVLMTEDQKIEEARSPTFIGRGATGRFPIVVPARSDVAAMQVDMNDQIEVAQQSALSARSSSPVTVVDAADESNTVPLPMDDENDVSLHYTRIIRRLDKDHRKAIHERDTELAGYRSRLHEMDTVYRQELMAKDFVIDDLKNRLSHLEDSVEEKLEKACNQVEDVWEARWNERNQLLLDKIRRLEDDRKKISKIPEKSIGRSTS